MPPSPPSVSVGEIHVPGNGLQNAKSFLLTSPGASAAARPELLFGLFAAETPRRVIEKLCDRLTDELRPVLFPGADERKFETALKLANRVILGFLYEHGLSLQGIRLRGTIGALNGDALFVSARGGVRGLVAVPAKGRLQAFTLFEEQPRPADPKFFSALLSGALPPGGRVLVATDELFTALDDAFVRATLSEPDSTRTTRDLKQALQGAKTAVSVLTLTTPLPEGGVALAAPAVRPARAPRPQPTGPAMAPADVGDMVARGLRAGGRLTGAGIRGGALLAWTLLRGGASALVAVPRTAYALARRDSRAELLERCRTAPDRCAGAVLDRLNAMPSPSRKQFLALLGVGTVFLHGLLFSFRHQLIAKEAQAYEAALAELHQLSTDYEAGLLYGNDARTTELLARMTAIASALPEETGAQREAKSEALSEVERDRLRQRRLLELPPPAPEWTLTDPAFAGGILARLGDRVFVFSRTEAASVELTTADQARRSTGFAPVAAVAPARTGFILTSTEGKLGFWRPGDEVSTSYDLTVDPQAPSMYYEGRYYALEGGKLMRRSVTLTALGSPADALQSEMPFAPAAFAADGAIYLVAADGRTAKVMRGRPADGYAGGAIDPPGTDAQAAWADPASDFLAFIDPPSGRLFILDKASGRLRVQVASTAFAGLSSLAASPDGKTFWILAGSAVYAIPADISLR